MVAKPYVIAGILGVAALVGNCSSGFASSIGSCAVTCADQYSKDSKIVPLQRGTGKHILTA
jgi:hypothetical protein